jgi:hypothetical protein
VRCFCRRMDPAVFGIWAGLIERLASLGDVAMCETATDNCRPASEWEQRGVRWRRAVEAGVPLLGLSRLCAPSVCAIRNRYGAHAHTQTRSAIGLQARATLRAACKMMAAAALWEIQPE